MAAAFSQSFRSRITFVAASPAAQARALPAKVGAAEVWKVPAISARVSTAPEGMPPPVFLEIAMMSGTTPSWSQPHMLAGAAEAGHDLVDDQQQAVAGADLAHPGQPAVGRDDAAATLDRLDDHRADVALPMAEMPSFLTMASISLAQRRSHAG